MSACLGPPAQVPARQPRRAATWPVLSAASAKRDWTIVHNAYTGTHSAAGRLAGRYRLAGTFFEFIAGASDNRKAILDDFSSGTQFIVSENDEIALARVVRIFADSVILRGGGGEEQLWLTFANRANSAANGSSEGSAVSSIPSGMAAGLGRRQIGENRWVYSRQSLLDYYQELRDNPERLVRVFDSLKPLYDEGHLITGYHLDIEGEAEFFQAAGLREGDVVRAVNGLPMTNRRRAEYFIGEFIQNRANAFVLDIGRGGAKQKLMYEVR